MKILAFDTSSIACSVALMDTDKNKDEQIKSLHKIVPMQQSGLILPMIDDLLHSFALKLTDLDAIAYGCGPGSFTGTRIASSVAQGLAFAAKLPIIQISSLAAIAQAAFREHSWEKLLVAIDAKMLKVYWAIYEVNSYGYVELTGMEDACHPTEIEFNSDEQKSKQWYGVGDGWKVYTKELEKNFGLYINEINPAQLPTSQAILELAKTKFEKKHWISAQNALPVYLT